VIFLFLAFRLILISCFALLFFFPAQLFPYAQPTTTASVFSSMSLIARVKMMNGIKKNVVIDSLEHDVQWLYGQVESSGFYQVILFSYLPTELSLSCRFIRNAS
jgi:hypothetical protein